MMKVLLATDGSDHATTAFRTAARLLRREDSEFDLLCVAPEFTSRRAKSVYVFRHLLIDRLHERSDGDQTPTVEWLTSEFGADLNRNSRHWRIQFNCNHRRRVFRVPTLVGRAWHPNAAD